MCVCSHQLCRPISKLVYICHHNSLRPVEMIILKIHLNSITSALINRYHRANEKKWKATPKRMIQAIEERIQQRCCPNQTRPPHFSKRHLAQVDSASVVTNKVRKGMIRLTADDPRRSANRLSNNRSQAETILWGNTKVSQPPISDDAEDSRRTYGSRSGT